MINYKIYSITKLTCVVSKGVTSSMRYFTSFTTSGSLRHNTTSIMKNNFFTSVLSPSFPYSYSLIKRGIKQMAQQKGHIVSWIKSYDNKAMKYINIHRIKKNLGTGKKIGIGFTQTQVLSIKRYLYFLSTNPYARGVIMVSPYILFNMYSVTNAFCTAPWDPDSYKTIDEFINGVEYPFRVTNKYGDVITFYQDGRSTVDDGHRITVHDAQGREITDSVEDVKKGIRNPSPNAASDTSSDAASDTSSDASSDTSSEQGDGSVSSLLTTLVHWIVTPIKACYSFLKGNDTSVNYGTTPTFDVVHQDIGETPIKGPDIINNDLPPEIPVDILVHRPDFLESLPEETWNILLNHFTHNMSKAGHTDNEIWLENMKYMRRTIPQQMWSKPGEHYLDSYLNSLTIVMGEKATVGTGTQLNAYVHYLTSMNTWHDLCAAGLTDLNDPQSLATAKASYEEHFCDLAAVFEDDDEEYSDDYENHDQKDNDN